MSRLGDLTLDNFHEVFKHVLGVEIAATASFFENGGDSLAAEELLDQFAVEHHLQIPLWDLLDHPSPKELFDFMNAQVD